MVWLGKGGVREGWGLERGDVGEEGEEMGK